MPSPITTYRAYRGELSPRDRAYALARSGYLFARSRLGNVPREGSFIRFPYYHHVFDDERAGFADQLRWFKNYGDFISLDDAISMLESSAPVRGRYFAITFDDGFRNSLTNAAPILADFDAVAAFFCPTRFIRNAGDDGTKARSHDGHSPYVEYLDWEECRRLQAAGMTIASHTVNHARLSELSDAEVERELAESKATIEKELGTPCVHFCPPWGHPGSDFKPEREPEIARRLGYRSFFTTTRGKNKEKPAPFLVTRDHVIAVWGHYQLRYFFSR